MAPWPSINYLEKQQLIELRYMQGLLRLHFRSTTGNIKAQSLYGAHIQKHTRLNLHCPNHTFTHFSLTLLNQIDQLSSFKFFLQLLKM